MRFAPHHVVAIVAMICTAAVLSSVGVMAATGTLVNIADPITASRLARVSPIGTLQVESRSGVPSNSFQVGRLAFGLERLLIAEAISPARLALTEVTLGSYGTASSTDATTAAQKVGLFSYVQGTGTEACGTTTTGYTRVLQRQFYVRNDAPSIQALWNGPPLVSPAAPNGKKVCLTLEVTKFTINGEIHMAASGYRW